MKQFRYAWVWESKTEFSDLEGLVILSVDGLEEGSDEVFFNTKCGRQFKMYHDQDCCESVEIDDICGDVDDIIGAVVVSAEKRTNEGDEDSPDKPNEYSESFTWTFYDIQTTKGSVNIKWLGESNGYYSESVDFVEGEPITEKGMKQ